MRISLFLLLVFPSIIFAQKVKSFQTKYYQSNQTKESYMVLKKNKNIKHGLYTSFYKDGTIHKKGAYNMNKKDGEWMIQSKHGKTILVYKNGKKVSEKKVGIWCEFFEHKQVEVCYDHDNHKKLPVQFYPERIDYPYTAIENHIQGQVIIQILLDDNFNNITSQKVLKSLSPEIDEASMKYALNFVKLIIKYDKKAILKKEITIPINFEL